jgi:hypothetical protein
LVHAVGFAGSIALELAVLVVGTSFDAGPGGAHLQRTDLTDRAVVGLSTSTAADVSLIFTFFNLADFVIATVAIVHAFGRIFADSTVRTHLRDLDAFLFRIELADGIGVLTIRVTGSIVTAKVFAGSVAGIAFFELARAIHHFIAASGWTLSRSRIAPPILGTLQPLGTLTIRDAGSLTDTGRAGKAPLAVAHLFAGVRDAVAIGAVLGAGAVVLVARGIAGLGLLIGVIPPADVAPFGAFNAALSAGTRRVFAVDITGRDADAADVADLVAFTVGRTITRLRAGAAAAHHAVALAVSVDLTRFKGGRLGVSTTAAGCKRGKPHGEKKGLQEGEFLHR